MENDQFPEGIQVAKDTAPFRWKAEGTNRVQ